MRNSIKNAVKSESRAKELLGRYVEENHLKNGHFLNITVRCECGETIGVAWDNIDLTLVVAVCENCGDDSDPDVIYLY